jgi:hypothetical protein
MSDSTPARRSHNRKLALAYAQAGIPIFPSVGKVPVCLEWTRLDTNISLVDRSEIIAKAAQRAADKNRDFDDDTPIGATTDAKEIRRRWDKFPDAVPSISLGPAKLYVLDADIDETRNGPELIRQWLAQNDIDISACPITESQSGGEHIFFQAEGLRSHIGDTMKSLYVQVKSTGNQVVAPGSWRDDGKMYKSKKGQPPLVTAFLDKILPAVPAPLIALQTERNTSSETKSDDALGDALEELRQCEQEDFDTLVDLYDFVKLAKKDKEFADVWNNPSPDTSANRFTLAKCLHREFGDAFRIGDFASLLGGYDGAGDFVGEASQKQHEYNNRNIARDYVGSKNSWKISDGSSFGAVDDDGDLPPHYVEAKEAQAELKAELKAEANDPNWGFESLGDLVAGAAPIKWLVKGLIECGTVGVPFGSPGVGKTAVFMDLGLRISHGLQWHDRKTRKMGVLYLSLEGPQGAKRRVQAWVNHQATQGVELDPHAPFEMRRKPIDLFTSREDEKKLWKQCKRFKKSSGYDLGLIVIDTMRAAMPGGDENTQPDTSIIFQAAQRLSQRTGATVILPHHTGKDEKKGASGSTNIIGSADFSMSVEKGRIRTGKVRDADDGQSFRFDIIGVEVGVDEDGDPQTAAVAVSVAETSAKAARSASEALGDVSDADDADAHGESESLSGAERKELKRTADREIFAKVIQGSSVPADQDGWKPLPDLVAKHSELLEYGGKNMKRNVQSNVLSGQPYALVSGGRIELKSKKGKPTVVRFVAEEEV